MKGWFLTGTIVSMMMLASLASAQIYRSAPPQGSKRVVLWKSYEAYQNCLLEIKEIGKSGVLCHGAIEVILDAGILVRERAGKDVEEFKAESSKFLGVEVIEGIYEGLQGFVLLDSLQRLK